MDLVSIKHVLKGNSADITTALLFGLSHYLIEGLNLLISFQNAEEHLSAFIFSCYIRYYLVNYVRFHILLCVFKTRRFTLRRFFCVSLRFLRGLTALKGSAFRLCFDRYFFLLWWMLGWESRKNKRRRLGTNERSLVVLRRGVEVEVLTVHSKLL